MGDMREQEKSSRTPRVLVGERVVGSGVLFWPLVSVGCLLVMRMEVEVK